MGHAAFAGGHVDVPAIASALIRGHYDHVQPFLISEKSSRFPPSIHVNEEELGSSR